MREVVLLQNLENLVQHLVADHRLDSDVATLEIASSLVSGAFAVGGRDGESLGPESLDVLDEALFDCCLGDDGQQLALFENQKPIPSITSLSASSSGIPKIRLNGKVMPRLAVK